MRGVIKWKFVEVVNCDIILIIGNDWVKRSNIEKDYIHEIKVTQNINIMLHSFIYLLLLLISFQIKFQ
jgi:hypothetical protein